MTREQNRITKKYLLLKNKFESLKKAKSNSEKRYNELKNFLNREKQKNINLITKVKSIEKKLEECEKREKEFDLRTKNFKSKINDLFNTI